MSEPQPKSGGFWSGWTTFAAGTAALLTAIGGLVGGLAAAGVIGKSEEASFQPPAQTTATTSTGPEETLVTFNPTPDERRLLRVVPADIQASCQRPTEEDKRLPSAVILFCYDPVALADGYVRFALFDSAPLLNRYMNERHSLGNAGERCGNKPSGAGVVRDPDGQTMGQLICYVDEVGAWIEWTNTPALVYGLAHRVDADWSALYDFWARVGPISP